MYFISEGLITIHTIFIDYFFKIDIRDILFISSLIKLFCVAIFNLLRAEFLECRFKTGYYKAMMITKTSFYDACTLETEGWLVKKTSSEEPTVFLKQVFSLTMLFRLKISQRSAKISFNIRIWDIPVNIQVFCQNYILIFWESFA